eukprot:6573436-Lingulodinium_polyedra.AAC.1
MYENLIFSIPAPAPGIAAVVDRFRQQSRHQSGQSSSPESAEKSVRASVDSADDHDHGPRCKTRC